ncbi:MAG TPA: YtxH domain-containing protein [Roseiflexaceae bacterium]|nr:YtxH domain-containing protein [Roseiflexaceae bacterium]
MGRFLLGFLIGALIGAAVVIFSAPRSGSETLQGIRSLIDDTIETAKQASAAHEQELWAQYRARLSAGNREQGTGDRPSL